MISYRVVYAVGANPAAFVVWVGFTGLPRRRRNHAGKQRQANLRALYGHWPYMNRAVQGARSFVASDRRKRIEDGGCVAFDLDVSVMTIHVLGAEYPVICDEYG